MSYIYEIKQASDLFHDLEKIGRDNFTYDGAETLMEYLIEIAESAGEPIKYDPIAYCCEFTEYADITELNREGYNYETWNNVMDDTIVIPFGTNSAIVQSF